MYKLGVPTYEYKVKMLARNDSRVLCIPGTYEMKSIMQQSYCMLSYYTIPHANLSMAEAIVLGLPAVAADTEEAREYSLDGRMACLFRMNDIDSFERAVRGLLADDSRLRASLASEDRKIVEEMFSPAKNISVLNTFLSGLVS